MVLIPEPGSRRLWIGEVGGKILSFPEDPNAEKADLAVMAQWQAQEAGYQGYLAYEMCSPLRGGGGEPNLDRCARRFLDYMASLEAPRAGGGHA